MRSDMKTMMILAATLMMMGCSGINNTQQMNTLPDTLQVGQSLLSRDTVEQVAYPVVSQEQRLALRHQAVPDMPAGTQLLGARPAGKGLVLEAYKIPTGENPNQFKVYLLTCDGKGAVVDAIDLHEFHTSEHKRPMTFGGNRFYTTDAELRFDGDSHVTLHRVMTLTSLYLKDHTLTELWRVEWNNHYEIDDNGHITFKGQQETYRTDGLDDPVIDEFKSRDLK